MKTELSEEEIEEAHQRYVIGQQNSRIAFVLTQRRKTEGLPAVKGSQIAGAAYKGGWTPEKNAYLASRCQTVAQALEHLKGQKDMQMMGMIQEFHYHFKREHRMFRKMFKHVKTPQDMLALSKGLEASQRRLFAFHAIRDKPLKDEAIPHPVTEEQDALSGGEQRPIEV